MVVRKGFSPLQMLNSLSNHLLDLEHMVFTNDGGFRRPGETTSVFPQQGVNLRWRWDADAKRVIIDFFNKEGLMKWRWDELTLCSELRFPSTVPDFECIGHVGRFTFDYVFRSTAPATKGRCQGPLPSPPRPPPPRGSHPPPTHPPPTTLPPAAAPGPEPAPPAIN